VPRVEVAITGVGAVSGYGPRVSDLWRGIAEGRDALGPIERFPCTPLASPLGGVLPPWPEELPGDDELR
jgi:3-oxoacyl-(acyl-carrier-protein) synthase